MNICPECEREIKYVYYSVNIKRHETGKKNLKTFRQNRMSCSVISINKLDYYCPRCDAKIQFDKIIDKRRK